MPNVSSFDGEIIMDAEFKAKVLTKLEGIEEAIAALAVSEERLRTRIYGNGMPGLITDVSSLRQIVDNLTVAIREQNVSNADKFSRRDRIFAWVGGAIGVLVISFLWNIFTGQIQVIYTPGP